MSEHSQQTDRVLRDTRILTLRIWTVVGCIVIAAVIFNLMGILAPVIEFLAVGSIIAFVMSPITNWLEHHGVNRGIGSLIALIVVVAVLVGVVCILSPILFGQIMEVLSRLPEQLRVAGGDLNEMISHAKTLNNTPLKEYLDDNLSSLVAVASKYVSQIAAELGRGVFPLITNTASQLFVIFLGLVLAYWMACDYPRMHHEICTIIGQEKETSYRFMVAILSRSVGGYMRGMVVTSICGGFLAFIGFMIIGHPYAALIIGSALMGPIGMIIAIPLCAALKGIFVYYFENETGRQLVAYDGAVFKGTPYRDADGNPVAAYDGSATIPSFTSPSSSATRLRPRPKRCLSPSSIIPGSSSRVCNPMPRASSRIPSPRTMTPTRTTIPKPASMAPWTIRILNRSY